MTDFNPRLNYVPIQPMPHQAERLVSQARHEVWIGGRNQGKTTALLMAALQFVDVADYRAAIIATSEVRYKYIRNTLKQWLRITDATWDKDTKTWTFPSGAVLRLYVSEDISYRMHLLHNETSGRYAFIGVDQIEDLDQHVYSNLTYQAYYEDKERDEVPDVPERFRATYNPERWQDSVDYAYDFNLPGEPE